MRDFLTLPLEIKALSKRQFEGHGSMFGNVDLGGDVVLAGAFKGSLKEHKSNGTLPQLFWMHQPDRVPGKYIEMEEDDKGLYVKGELADTELGNEMHTLLNMKAVRGMSIGYQTKDYSYDKEGNRLLKELDLWEVSLVSLAMNPLAKITASKSRLSESGEYVPTIREFEIKLRDAGLPASIAKKVISTMKFSEEPEEGDEMSVLLKSLDNLNAKIRGDEGLEDISPEQIAEFKQRASGVFTR